MIQGEYVLNTLLGLERVLNRYGTDTQLNITFQVLHSMVWNGGVWNGIRGLDPELWIGVWIGMGARLCSGPFISSGSHMLLNSNASRTRLDVEGPCRRISVLWQILLGLHEDLRYRAV